MKRALVMVVLVACSSSRTEPAPETKPAPTHGVSFVVVDEGSDYMKRVYRHVGANPDGQPSDPAAKAAGVRPEIDQWRTDDAGERHTDYFLLGGDRLSLEHYVTKLAASDAAFRLPDDRQIVFEALEPDGWRTYYVPRTPELDQRAIERATTDVDPYTEQPVVMLYFTPEATRAFGDLTNRIIGKKLATIVDGTVYSAPIIMGAIRGGRISIRSRGSDPSVQQVEAAALAKKLSPAP